MKTEIDVMNTLDAAGLMKVHVETIRRLARRGEVPAFKVGKDWRFYYVALRQWANEQGRRRAGDSAGRPAAVVSERRGIG